MNGEQFSEEMTGQAGRWERDRIWPGVRERSHGAVAFCRNWGFENAGARPFRLGNDVSADIIMQKSVETGGI